MATIDDFIQQRLLDAKGKLEKIDPSFVKTIDSAQKLSLKGIQLKRIEPTVRFPKRWITLLEICADVAGEAEQLHLITDSLNPKNFEGREQIEIGREGTRHLFDWVIHEQALIEKVRLLVIRTIDVSLPSPSQELKKQIRIKYETRIWKGVGRRFSSARHGLVHGAGPKGTVYRAIPEEQLWESLVALQAPIDKMLLSTWTATSKFLSKWHKEKVLQADKLLDFLGSTLHDLETELAEHQEPSGGKITVIGSSPPLPAVEGGRGR